MARRFLSSWLIISRAAQRGTSASPPPLWGRVKGGGRAPPPPPGGGEEGGGGSRSPPRQGAFGAFDNLVGPRDPPPLPAPTRGGGHAKGVDSVEAQQALALLPDVARLGTAWVEAYHAEDASVATVGELGSLSPACLPG